MLLLWAEGYRHEIWGLIGAMDQPDVDRLTALVADLKIVRIPSAHEIHMLQPQRYIDEVLAFVDELRKEGKLAQEKMLEAVK